METLPDPGSLRDRSDVEFSAETTTCGPDGFEYFSSIAGMVAVGITDERGECLLMDSPHGWRLPYGPVDTDEDWAAAARRVCAELTGVESAVEVDHVARATRLTHRVADGERETVTHDAVVGMVPVTGTPVAADPDFGPWGGLEVAWFEAVPEDAYWDHEDAVDDIRRFVG